MAEVIAGLFVVCLFLLILAFSAVLSGLICGQYRVTMYGAVAFVVIGIAALSCLPSVNHSIEIHEQERQESQESVRQEGRKAYRLGVPANANPYQGNRYHGTDSRLWLEGWMSAKEEEVAK